ncbi:glutamine amidotransferase [Poseidonocella sedimentorum]|uniref:GMP synthase (Glutamine-hydrolysing) n=1 Tax=Poseidonocella sedimentorum TaxID=871652 RepID=A0A1I6DGS4_9RHOB|nr:glutamine amidotransferase [Poseidonocella sedimentorum]SFR04588.1 GMP synthase (glutamine-hydrolysing) [Poseidonocella sedimentorum]
MKPFLILQLRPERAVSDNEYEAILAKGGLEAQETIRVCLDHETLPDGLSLSDVAGVIVGGGPGCVSDPPESKDPVEARIEATILGLMPEITAHDIPFMGCCYGIGILGHHLGAPVGQDKYGEPVGPVLCEQTPDAEEDPLLKGLPQRFHALVGHKEAVEALPEGCVSLLSSAPCPFQMIRYGANVYATQFHPEADAEVFDFRIKAYGHKGYFAPHEVESILDACRMADVSVSGEVLRRFVARYRTGSDPAGDSAADQAQFRAEG